MFGEQGYDKTSLREIAERLGVTKATLYYHFKSATLTVGATCQVFLQQVDDPDKLRAIILEIATDLIH